MGSNPTSDKDFFVLAECSFHYYLSAVSLKSHEVAWPSGLRRWFKAPVSSGAWVRIPPLPKVLFDAVCLSQKYVRGHTDLNHGPIGLQPIALPLSYIPFSCPDYYRLGRPCCYQTVAADT